MRHLLLSYLILVNTAAIAQSGFSKTILLPSSKSCTISSLLIDQDTIVCFGTLYGINEGKWGVYIAKFDSLGNFLQINTDFDTTFQQTIDPYCQIIRTSDGGYIGVGSQGVGNKTAAYKFSHTGELEWKHFYREPDFQVVIIYSTQELSDGYLCFGRYSVDYDNSNFTMKLSKSGEMIWFSKEISVPGVNDVMAGRVIKWRNNFMVGSGQGPISINESWVKTALIEVDSNGQVVWDWHGPITNKETGVLALVMSPDSNIVIATKRYFTNALNGLSAKHKFRCLQPETGNTIWQTELPSFELSFENSSTTQIKASPDGGGFDAVGYNYYWYNGFIMRGLLAHYDWDGNLIWLRYDTAHVDTVLVVSENKLYDMAYLSSGSIIGVGQIERGDPYSHLEGWLIKWSANGCLEPDDCATVGTNDDPVVNNNERKDWEIFPNPATDFVWLCPPRNLDFRKGEIQIMNTIGQVIYRQIFGFISSGCYQIPLYSLPSGLYFYQIVADGAVYKTGHLRTL